MSAAKQKGSGGERELAKLLVKAGLTEAKRTPLSGGLSDFPGDVFLNGYCAEVKRQETTKIWEWWAQACAAARGGRHPILFFRRSRSEWLVTMSAETWAGEQAEIRRLRVIAEYADPEAEKLAAWRDGDTEKLARLNKVGA